MDEMVLDIFRTDDFRATTMTELVENIDYVPYELEAMNIFDKRYVRTTTVTYRQTDGELTRIPTTPRGAPEPTARRDGQIIRQMEGTRLAQRDQIVASEVQNILNPQLPQAQRLLSANELVGERQQKLLDNLNYTKEFHRLGAIQGVVYDADGTSVIADWYDMFGIARPTPITFNFANFKQIEDQGDLRALVQDDIMIPMRRALKRRFRPGTRVHALVGDDFWSALSSSPAYERTMLTDAMRQALNDDRSWLTIDLGGVTWHHYFGSDDQALEIQPDQAIFFPMGARQVFEEVYLPGENLDEVNQPGREVYSIVSPDYRINMNEWVDVYVKSYPIFACLCPQALFTGELG
jgi:hypothetical protein